MSSIVTLFTDRSAFEPLWRPALEQHGLTAQVRRPEELPGAIDHDSLIVVDAAAAAYDEDELLTALGLARALGTTAITHLPAGDEFASIDDLIEEMCAGLVARHDADITHLTASLARRVDGARRHRFEFVTVSPRNAEILTVLGDGFAALIARPVSAEDDGSEVVSIAIGQDASTATLELGSGHHLELRATSVNAERERKPLNGSSNGAALDGARLGARLRELRLAAGLTQAELARRTGIHRPNIARVEAGRHTPSLDTLSRLASAIGVSTTQVLTDG
jgi:DNA-binding XRE family transcriptional regulator